MQKKSSPKYVTEVVFVRETRNLNLKIDASVERLASAIVKNSADIEEIKATMMTRQTGDQILAQLQDLGKKYETAEISARIHLNQVMDFRPRIEDHEKRLGVLEEQSHLKD
jgi:hypothetical protein